MRAGVAVLVLALTPPALAGGFQVNQHGAKASGRADAFSAMADDATATYYNPAAVAKLPGYNLYVGGTWYSRETTLDLMGGDRVDMDDGTGTMGDLYVTGQLGKHYAFAIGFFEPFSLRTRWPAVDPIATSAIDTRWSTRELNINIIGKINEKWSVAVGLEVVRAEIETFSSGYDFTRLSNFLVPPPTEPPTADRDFTLQGEKAGANLGVHYGGETGLQIGLSIRSKKVIDMTGDLTWSNVGDDTLNPLLFVVGGGCPSPPTPCPMATAFTNAEAATTLNLPAVVQAAVGQRGLGKWEWEVDLLYARWDDFKEVEILVAPTNAVAAGLVRIPTVEDRRQEEDWHDSLSVLGGFDYHVNAHHAVRGGLAYDQSPIKEEWIRPYNPDADKVGVTAGYGWSGLDGLLTVDVFGQAWFYETASEPSPEPLTGVVAGSYDTTVLLFGAGLNFHF